MKKKYILAIIVAATALFFSIHTEVFAADMNFSVEANIPKNQIDKSQTYFDLRMKPGQQQDISINIENGSDESATFSIVPHIAVTNQNGVVDYGQDLKKDSSLNIGFTDVVSGDTAYTLAGKETKKAIFHLKMPKQSFDGIILGGFEIRKVEKEAEKSEKKSVQIENQYTYVIGAKLSENNTSVKPEVVLNKIKPALQNYRTVVTANLQNTQPVMVNGLKLDAKVSNKSGGKILHETKKEEMSMAPNSNFDFPISWDNQALKTGTYHLSLSAEDKNGNKWAFEEDFEIKGKESNSLNKGAVELEKNYTIWIISALVLLVVIIIIAWVLIKNRKKRQLLEKKRLKQAQKKKGKNQTKIKKANKDK